jgi:Mg-chelatase subunit ChlD
MTGFSGRVSSILLRLVTLLAVLGCASNTAAQDVSFRDFSVKADKFPNVDVRFRLRVPSAGVFPADMRPTVSVDENGGSKPLQLSSEPDSRAARYLFAIDTSGSMKSLLPGLKTGLHSIVSALPKDSEIGLMTFNDGADLRVPFTKERTVIDQAIDALAISGKTTELNYGLIRAGEILNNGNDSKKNIVIAFSDGKDEGRAYTIEAVIEAAKAADTRIFAVGLGTGTDTRDLMKMRRMAEASGGRYRDYEPGVDPTFQKFLEPSVEDFWWSGTWTSSLPEDGSRHSANLQIAYGNTKSTQQIGVQSSLSTFNYMRQSRFLIPVLVLVVLAALIFILMKQREVGRLVAANARSSMDTSALEAKVEEMKHSVRAAIAEGSRRFVPDKTIVETPRSRNKTVFSRGNGAAASLDVTQGPREGERFEIVRPVTSIGRDLNNDICIPEGRISSSHARITREDGKFFIEDLNSTNGTFIDGRKVSGRVQLTAGAVVRMGGASMKFNHLG